MKINKMFVFANKEQFTIQKFYVKKDFENIFLTKNSFSVMDASGKYTWGLLSSNNFWTGFPDQCRELERMFAKKERSVEEMRSKVPPFSVAVYSVKLNLTLLAPTISEVQI